ncbi:MAG: hemolysin family protein [Negativicutes bacterium]|nr:hemolysin family protein [Negativicutes bacterium]
MDSSSISTELTIILFLILANGLFAMTEMSIVSSRKSRLEHLAAQGSKGAKKALQMAEDPTDLLSAVQIGITLIGILTGAFGGATLSSYLATPLKAYPGLTRYADALSLAIVVSAITYASLIIGELVPKRLALNNPEPIAVFVARPMSAFVRINRPLVRFLSFSTKLVLAILRVKPPDEPPVTEEEVKVLIGQGAQHGVFEEAEREMVENIFILSDMRVSALMTPRTQIEWLDLEDTTQYNLDLISKAKYSTFPVARGSLDDIVGVVYAKDLLATVMAGQDVNLETAAVQALYVPRNMPALKVLDLFKQQGTHFAFVADEFGGIDGLVTLHDIVEHIMGELPASAEKSDPDVVQREDGSWLLDGMLPVEEFKELFGFDDLPREERDQYQTLAGFAISQFGYIPQVAESFEWCGYRFEVIDMDRTRIDKILVTQLPPANETELTDKFTGLP